MISYLPFLGNYQSTCSLSIRTQIGFPDWSIGAHGTRQTTLWSIVLFVNFQNNFIQLLEKPVQM